MKVLPRGLHRVLLSLVWLLSCGGCDQSGKGLTLEKVLAGVPPVDGERVSPDEGLFDGTGESPSAMDPAEPEREKDHGNRYSSVVLIKSGLGFCSGVLTHPRLMLTAAHCLCPQGSKGKEAGCMTRATAVSVFYQRSGETWRPVLDSTEGTVVVHPGFLEELERAGDKTRVKNRMADLAVVHLERQLEHTRPEGHFRHEEVLLQDKLILTGFGAASSRGSPGGERRFGGNMVTGLRLSSDRKGRELVFHLPGAHAQPGDSGGPCFLEEGGVRWLVGINSGYVSQGATESWFTSTSSYREWIEEQLAEARKRSSAVETPPQAPRQGHSPPPKGGGKKPR